MKKVLIILPTYNEAANIEKLINKIIKLGCEVLVVDDNSPDKTFEIVENLKTQFKNINLIKRSGKLGLGSAYREGFKWALENNFLFIVEMDADFSHSLEDLEKMLSYRSKYDVIIGSRYTDEGKIEGWSKKRYYLSLVANKVVRLLAFTKVNELTGGFRIYTADALKKIDAINTKNNGYAFQIEMTINSIIKGLSIKEVPITFRERSGGISKMNKFIIVEAIFYLMKIPFIRFVGIFR